jgi:hypothetical protein
MSNNLIGRLLRDGLAIGDNEERPQRKQQPQVVVDFSAVPAVERGSARQSSLDGNRRGKTSMITSGGSSRSRIAARMRRAINERRWPSA